MLYIHLAHFSGVMFRCLDPIDTTTKMTAPRMTASKARTPRPVANYNSPIIGNDTPGDPLWVATSRG